MEKSVIANCAVDIIDLRHPRVRASATHYYRFTVQFSGICWKNGGEIRFWRSENVQHCS